MEIWTFKYLLFLYCLFPIWKAIECLLFSYLFLFFHSLGNLLFIVQLLMLLLFGFFFFFFCRWFLIMMVRLNKLVSIDIFYFYFEYQWVLASIFYPVFLSSKSFNRMLLCMSDLIRRGVFPVMMGLIVICSYLWISYCEHMLVPQSHKKLFTSVYRITLLYSHSLEPLYYGCLFLLAGVFKEIPK